MTEQMLMRSYSLGNYEFNNKTPPCSEHYFSE